MSLVEWAPILQAIAALVAAVGGVTAAHRAVTKISVRSSARAEVHTHYHGVQIAPRRGDAA